MTTRPHRKSARRIMVAIDASLSSLDTLETAVGLASRVQAHLMALFVEDVSLFQLAELPFASELDRASGVARRLDPVAISQAMEIGAQRLRRMLEQESERRRVSSSLKVVRGHYLTAAIEAAAESDIVFLSNVTRVRFDPLRARVGAVVPPGRRGRPLKPVWTLFDGSKAARRALSLAHDLSQEQETELVVLIPAGDGFDELCKAGRDIVGSVDVRFQSLTDRAAQHIVESLAESGCLLFVLPRTGRHILDDLPSLLAQLECPLVVVS